VPDHATNMLETYADSRNMPVILALLTIIFRRYVFYITLSNNVVELHKIKFLELAQSLVGRLCHLWIEEILFKFLLARSGWGCTWQDAWSHSLQTVFFTVPTGPNPALIPLVFMVLSKFPQTFPHYLKYFHFKHWSRAPRGKPHHDRLIILSLS
jgi:hypothetical protein